MVDTINPQTGQSDNFENPSVNAEPTVGSGFYSGFGKAEDVHLNLAAEASNGAPDQSVPAAAPITQSTSDVKPSQPEVISEVHQTYSKNSQVNFRLVLFVLGIGLVIVVIAGLLTYFIAGQINGNKLETEKETLSSLNEELNQLQTPPEKLELPATTPPPVTNTVVPEPPKVEEKPIQTETPTTSPTQPDGLG